MSDPAPADSAPSSSTSSNPRRVAYFYDPDVGNYVYYLGHPMKPHRIRMAHNLIVNYGLCDEEEDGLPDGSRALNDPLHGVNGVNGIGGLGDGRLADQDGSGARYDKALLRGARGTGMQVFKARRAGKEEMTRFHTDEYVELLEQVTPENGEALTGGGTRGLTGDDCPPFEGVFEFCSMSAGGSIAAAERLNSGQADICINWAGGLHHAKKTEASGFCYINDIVLGILELLRIHPRVLYIDADVHHGDGVEEAFYTTDRVMTASFHRFGEFFPGTGDVRDIGMKRGKGYAVNVPLRDGINDESFHQIFKPVIQHIMDWYRPGAVVLQMGADSLAGDKLGGFNVTLDGHAECARFVKSFGVPTMMLGGGGYTIKNVARAWTNETAVMCGRELDVNLPYNQYMEYYGPRYKLEVLANNADDHNPPEYLNAIKRTVIENLRDLPHAPGAQLRNVPGRRLGSALGMKDVEISDPEDEVDERIRSMLKRQHGGVSSDSSDSELDDRAAYARPSRSRWQGQSGTSNRRRARRKEDAMDVDMDEDDDDPCRAKKRTFFSSRGGATPAAAPKGTDVNGTIRKRMNGNGNGMNTMAGLNGLGIPTGLPGPGSGSGSQVGFGAGLNGNGNGVVEGWEGSRAASPMSVA